MQPSMVQHTERQPDNDPNGSGVSVVGQTVHTEGFHQEHLGTEAVKLNFQEESAVVDDIQRLRGDLPVSMIPGQNSVSGSGVETTVGGPGIQQKNTTIAFIASLFDALRPEKRN